MTQSFSLTDYIVFGISLLISAIIGLYYRFSGTRQKSTTEFFLGDRSMPIFPVAVSLWASFMSAVFLLGTPAEIYTNGITFSYILFGYLVAFPLTAHIFVPIIHKLKLTSAYEYFKLRYGLSVQIAASSSFISMTLLYLGVVLYTPALAFSQVSGLSTWISIFCVGIVCTFYTAMGGLKAVVWTDTFQMSIVVIGLVTLIIKGGLAVGGLHFVWKAAVDGGKMDLDIFSFDPLIRQTFWTQVVGGCMLTVILYAGNQTMLQRYISIRKTKDAKMTVYLALIMTIIGLLLTTFLGLIMYAKYKDADPISLGYVSKSDQLVLYFMLEILENIPGFSGLFTAAVFSAALSSVSSGVNSLSVVVYFDIISPLYELISKEQLSEIMETRVSKTLAIVFGLFSVAMGYIAPFMGPQVLQLSLSIFGVVGGPLFGMFCLALFNRQSNSIGAIIGLISGLFMTSWMQIGAILKTVNDSDNSDIKDNFLHDFYSVSYMWYALIGPAVTVFIGSFVSLLTYKLNPPHISNEELLFGLCRKNTPNLCDEEEDVAKLECHYKSISMELVGGQSKKKMNTTNESTLEENSVLF